MKPEEREDQRYAQKDFCSISHEEEIMFSLLEQYIKQQKLDSQNVKILDIGCGSGRIGKKIAEKGYNVVGLDFSSEAIKKALEIGIHAKWCNLDEGIPEEDNFFDVVWAGDIIEHVFDPINLLKEVNRVLKSDGIAIMTIPSDVGLISRIKILFGISHQEQMYMTSGFYKHHTFFTPRLIKFMLQKAGFISMEIFKKILILGEHRYETTLLPSAFFNEMIIQVRKT